MTIKNPLLQVSDLHVALHTTQRTVVPVRGASYNVMPGETVAVVGESGSGKTILNLAPVRLLPPGVDVELTGSVKLGGDELVGMTEHQLKAVRGRRIGTIFQDPLTALNPMRRVGSQLIEGIERHLNLTATAAEARAIELITLVGIPDAGSRLWLFPHELSGGMRQRVMIAIGICGEPDLLIADEPTTALDVTIQAQIVQLLKSLQTRLGMAIMLITHDIGVVAGMADKVLIMYAGRIVEAGTSDEVLVNPKHPYTTGLLGSVPEPNAEIGAAFRGLPGFPPDFAELKNNCAFIPRCPRAQETCSRGVPKLRRSSTSPTHLAACPVAFEAQVEKANAQ